MTNQRTLNQVWSDLVLRCETNSSIYLDKSQSQTGAVPTSFDQPVRQGGQHEELTAVPPGLVLTDFSSDRGAQGQRVLPTVRSVT